MSGLRPSIRNRHNSRFREWKKTAIEILSDPTPDMLAMPRFYDGVIGIQALIRRLAKQVANAAMDAEANRPCSGGAKSRNGYRESSLASVVGTLTLRFPKLHTGSFFPQDLIERCQRVDRAAVAEKYAAGTSTRKVQRAAEKWASPDSRRTKRAPVKVSFTNGPNNRRELSTLVFKN